MPRRAAIFPKGRDPALMETFSQFQMSNFGGSDLVLRRWQISTSVTKGLLQVYRKLNLTRS